MAAVAQVNTEELMQVALDMAGFEVTPNDSTVYVPGEGLQRILFGLDIGAGELMMAQELGYDAVIAHHAVGLPHRSWSVFRRHVDLLTEAGVPQEAARQAVDPKVERLRIRGQSRNYEQVPMVARRLRIPFLNIHCPLDEVGRWVMQDTIDAVLDAVPDATLDDIVEALAALPAAQRADTDIMVPLGDPSARAGKVVVAHGALTNGGYDIARAYFEHGVDTVVYIHISFEDLKRLRGDERGQLIVTGHVVGDAFGIAPYIDALRELGLEVDVLSEVCAESA